MAKRKIKYCPWCGDVSDIHIVPGLLDRTKFDIVCFFCNTRRMNFDSEEEAKAAWMEWDKKYMENIHQAYALGFTTGREIQEEE